MGIYGVSTRQGGWVSYYGLWSFPWDTTDTSESRYNFNVLSPVRGQGGNDDLFPAGDSTYNAYMITESVQNVVTKMNELGIR